MRLTALDIREQQFKRVMRGLDADEVEGFLDAVAREVENLVAENQELRLQIHQAEEKLEDYTRMEKALRDALIGAERLVTEARDNARREAEVLVRQAEVTAQRATSNIAEEMLMRRRELQELRKLRASYASRLRWLMQSHLDMLADLEGDFDRAETDTAGFSGPNRESTLTSRPDEAEEPGSPLVDGLAEDLEGLFPEPLLEVGTPQQEISTAPPVALEPQVAPMPQRATPPPQIPTPSVSPNPPTSPSPGGPGAGDIRARARSAGGPPHPPGVSGRQPSGTGPLPLPESRREKWPPGVDRQGYDPGDPGAAPPRPGPGALPPSARPKPEGRPSSNWSMERFREELME